jgi:hypothetical protein
MPTDHAQLQRPRSPERRTTGHADGIEDARSRDLIGRPRGHPHPTWRRTRSTGEQSPDLSDTELERSLCLSESVLPRGGPHRQPASGAQTSTSWVEQCTRPATTIPNPPVRFDTTELEDRGEARRSSRTGDDSLPGGLPGSCRSVETTATTLPRASSANPAPSVQSRSPSVERRAPVATPFS